MSQSKIYKSFASIPFANFMEILKTNDYRYLFDCPFDDVLELPKLKESEQLELKGIYEQIYEEYYQKYGFNEILSKILEKDKKKSILMMKSVREASKEQDPKEKERIINRGSNFINILQAEVKALLKKLDKNSKGGLVDIDELAVIVEDFKKRSIDPYTISAKKFFFMRKQMTDHFDRQFQKK